MHRSLIDRFVEFHSWRTSQKSALLMAIALPFHLLFTPVVIYASDRAGIADGDSTRTVFFTAIGAVALCFAASLWASRQSGDGRWSAYLIVVVYGTWIAFMAGMYGLWSTPLEAWVPTVVILVVVWFDLQIGIFALIFALLGTSSIIVATQAEWIPYAPVLVGRDIGEHASAYWAVAMLTPFLGLFVAVFGLVGLSSAALIRQRDKLDLLARTDHLTGIANRRDAEEKIRNAIEAVRRSNRPIALALVDVDEFKSINDTYSHHAGDIVLRAVADLMTDSTRHNDIHARLGGDEFLICFPDATAEAAGKVCEDLREGVSQLRFDDISSDLRVSISVGVAAAASTSFPELMRNADAALYETKRRGRNGVTVFGHADGKF